MTQEVLGEVRPHMEPTFDDVCRWTMTRFAGVQRGWWMVRRFGKRRVRQGTTGGEAPSNR